MNTTCFVLLYRAKSKSVTRCRVDMKTSCFVLLYKLKKVSVALTRTLVASFYYIDFKESECRVDKNTSCFDLL